MNIRSCVHVDTVYDPALPSYDCYAMTGPWRLAKSQSSACYGSARVGREAYSAPSAAPSASTTRLVSSLEIRRASARCMSVMVQKDATRWSGDRTGDVTGHNLPLCGVCGAMHFTVSTCKSNSERSNTIACAHSRQDGPIHSRFV